MKARFEQIENAVVSDASWRVSQAQAACMTREAITRKTTVVAIDIEYDLGSIAVSYADRTCALFSWPTGDNLDMRPSPRNPNFKHWRL
jgi:hypothetical protein